MTHSEILGPNSNLFVKIGKFRMTWHEKYVYG